MSLRLNMCIVAVVAASIASVTPVSAQTDSAASATPGKKAARKQNHQLELKVRHALTATRHLDSSGIVILARGSEVTLEGDVPDDGQIQLAAASAAKVAGVTGVNNELHVHEPGN
jgi:hyperosmotically inducible periplasmic protein